MFTVYLASDSKQSCPLQSTASGFNRLAQVLMHELDRVEKALDVDVSPLRKIAEDDQFDAWDDWLMELGDNFPDEEAAEEAWREHLARNEDAWQPPDGLAGALERIIERLDDQPARDSLLRQMKKSKTFNDTPYFLEGEFRQDLVDLRQMVIWQRDHQARLVRLDIWM